MIAALTEDLVIGVCLTMLVVVTAWKAAGWWQRRQALQAFAATRVPTHRPLGLWTCLLITSWIGSRGRLAS